MSSDEKESEEAREIVKEIQEEPSVKNEKEEKVGE